MFSIGKILRREKTTASKLSIEDAESFTPAGNFIEHVMCRCLRESFKEAVFVWGNTREADLT
jgi:hypothetical protein